ncbi:cupin domain-containing protein [Flavobacterium difficile]|uniref:Cupin domain-containing protein n=1 Tax=Flavobacterium difficile TaxID=2709659 RepID=A0ABX0I5E5_9FLAO|nr:cupin domain-containing protein [Flavobacterium difficile]NHM01348.1 cupin domain-containing protein [Flavobacterium difficile]
MDTIENYINSGILELYVLGLTSEEENTEISELVAIHVELKREIEAIEQALNVYAEKIAPEISEATKEWIMTTINYTERLQNGEEVANPPRLNKNSKIEDFDTWLKRDNMQAPDDFDALHAKIIAATPEAKTLIVWLRYGAPPEEHTNEMEHFLIVEGTCDITIGEQVHHLIPGDYLSIPLYVDHDVKVTSSSPCKVILQRVAA